MRLAFWISFALVAYAYIGYAIWLKLLARIASKPVAASPIHPSVSIIIAARNEEATLPAKLENLANLNYPKELLQIIIASDGSTDGTPGLLGAQGPQIVPVILEESQGKANALNHAVKQATGDILVFLDARQYVDRDAVAELVCCFADPAVGAVSGELILEDTTGGSAQDALGIYWKIEKVVRKLESATGSVVGVTGAIYAMRRNLYTEIPVGTILDDVFAPMNVVRQGKRVIFQPSAIARDRLFVQKGKEFSRKVRTLTGNYQLLQLAPWLISPRNPLLFRFVSHKLMRLFVPVFLVIMLVASAMASGTLFRLFFAAQVLFYALAAFGMMIPPLRKIRPVAIANTFVMLNVAAALALYNFVSGHNKVWVR